MLIRNGHNARELPHYTRRQIELYYRQAMRLDDQARADRILDVNRGMSGGAEADQLIKTLRGERVK